MDGLNLSRIIQEILLVAPGFLLAITVHEFAHGYVAYRFGDPTAKSQGRLTFNPISHLDPFGTLVLVVTRTIGWAKPVPVDPRYLRNPRADMLWISLAGPAANLVVATILAAALHLLVFATGGRPSGRTLQFHSSAFRLAFCFSGFGSTWYWPCLTSSLCRRWTAQRFLPASSPGNRPISSKNLEPYGFLILMLLIFLPMSSPM